MPCGAVAEALRCKSESRWLHSRWGHCDFSLSKFFLPHYVREIDSVSEMSTRNLPCGRGVKGGQYIGLTTLPPAGADCVEILGDSTSWGVWASPGLYRDSFYTLYIGMNGLFDRSWRCLIFHCCIKIRSACRTSSQFVVICVNLILVFLLLAWSEMALFILPRCWFSEMTRCRISVMLV